MGQMAIAGISAGFHDAALSIVSQQGDILFAAHSERYSRIKSDCDIDTELASQLENYDIKHFAYYERPWLKQIRQFYSGQGLDWEQISTHKILQSQLGKHYQNCNAKISSYSHHLSHAAAGFQTSPYDKATVVVIDAIGEFDSISIYAASYNRKGIAVYKKLWGQRYPHSIGLFYSAMTAQAGLRPVDEEYILMGMAAYGDGSIKGRLEEDLVADASKLTLKHNLHIGMPYEYSTQFNRYNIAAASQLLVEKLIYNVMKIARDFQYSSNLVYMGGVALNCLANRNLGKYFNNIWIMPNPGDAGSSLGAAALAYGKQLNWQSPYLGFDITGPYPTGKLITELLTAKITGVASGPAEFGPRALGNRSLLADPRGNDIKDLVNEIKRRQKFRPFAPAILEEFADEYFEMPRNSPVSPYMQVVAKCRQPEKFPAIVHADGTSRVQTVAKNCKSGIRSLLEVWYAATGCPMLLNTSLNIRGEPMVNTVADAQRFQKRYGIKVFS
jgi:carbamoyltransferase